MIAPNFLSQELDPGPPPEIPRSGCLFVGRLSEEKGIRRLLEDWPDEEPLRIVGDGPQRAALQAAAALRPNVTVVGPLPRSAVIDAMRSHRRLVFPSQWLEGFPLVYPEALACGLGVFAFRPSALADLASRDNTGTATSWNEHWPDLLKATLSLNDPSPAYCRDVFEQRYSEASFHRRLTALVDSLYRAQREQAHDPRGHG
jgi:glycosyltransferase involved in cell wall biosynthesis